MKRIAVESQFWALENPMLSPNYAALYGVPPQNVTGGNTFLLVGQLREGAAFVTRSAPAFGQNPGGAVEVVVEAQGLKIIEFVMPG